MSQLSKRSIEELLEYAWLNLSDLDKVKIENPFKHRTRFELDNPHIHLLKIIRKPEYFPFTCQHILNLTIAPFQTVILQELWYRKYMMLVASRGAGKTWILALYALLRALLCQGSKVTFVGGSFRQAKTLFDNAENFWANAPVLRSMFDINDKKLGPRRSTDRVTMNLGESRISGLPIGNGETIRGERSTNLIVDEFNTVPEEIYEMVISPFTAVHANPIQKMKESSRRTLLENMGNTAYGLEDDGNFGNQSILAGTPGYTFQHFFKYFEQYKGIVQSKGNIDLLREVFRGDIPKNFNWKHYAVLRMSHELLPDNYLDADTIARSKATVDIGTFLSEYGATFISDSNGFFKRSLIEGCTTNRVIMMPQSGPVQFTASLTGSKSFKYIYAVDPASEKDNFSIVILELHPDHRRVVYCWTTTRKKHRAQVKKGITQEITFYEYCVRKLRDLMRLFPCERIMVDAMGGGYAVEEAFHAQHLLEPGEQFVWRVIDQEDPQEWDSYAGQHLLEMVQFAKADWVNLANHGLKKDMEDKVLLFPMFDAVKLAYSIEKDKRAGCENDTLEDCMLEIEELKNELTTITHNKTISGRDKWDTPEIKLAGNKKGRLKKDRYSALVMANMGARILQAAAPPIPEYNPMGGFAHAIKKPEGSHALYCGVVPPELQKVASADSTYGCVVRRS